MKFTDEVLGRIWGALQAGISQEAACAAHGVSGRQYRRILEQGKADEADDKQTRAREILDKDREVMAVNTGSVEKTFYGLAVGGENSHATVAYLKLKQPSIYNPERTAIQREAVEAVFASLEELAPGVGATVRGILEKGEQVIDVAEAFRLGAGDEPEDRTLTQVIEGSLCGANYERIRYLKELIPEVEDALRFCRDRLTELDRGQLDFQAHLDKNRVEINQRLKRDHVNPPLYDPGTDEERERLGLPRLSEADRTRQGLLDRE